MSTDVVVAMFTGLQTAAVIFGLIFVSVQVRDSRRIAKGGAYQNWLNTILEFFMALANNGGLSQLYWRGRKDIASLDETEMSQFFYLCVTYFTLIENLYVQFDQGLIPDDVFRPWQYGFTDGLKGSGFVEYWRLESLHYTPVFRTFVNQLLLEQDETAKDTKISAFWSLVNTDMAHPTPPTANPHSSHSAPPAPSPSSDQSSEVPSPTDEAAASADPTDPAPGPGTPAIESEPSADV